MPFKTLCTDYMFTNGQGNVQLHCTKNKDFPILFQPQMYIYMLDTNATRLKQLT